MPNDVLGRTGRCREEGRWWLAGAVFAAAVIGIAAASDRWGVAVYALSFWHYATYALAYLCCAIPLAAFKRDAVVLKAVALVALAAVYFALPLNALSLLVVAAGLALNAWSAAALGSDRTYYGHELEGLPATWVTSFPYSVMAHPMLIGSMAAFAGTLLHPTFRRDWWPLALAHVVLNLAVLLIEIYARPAALRRRSETARLDQLKLWPVGLGLVVAGAAVGLLAANGLTAIGVALCLLGYGGILLERYGRPRTGGGPR